MQFQQPLLLPVQTKLARPQYYWAQLSQAPMTLECNRLEHRLTKYVLFQGHTALPNLHRVKMMWAICDWTCNRNLQSYAGENLCCDHPSCRKHRGVQSP